MFDDSFTLSQREDKPPVPDQGGFETRDLAGREPTVYQAKMFQTVRLHTLATSDLNFDEASHSNAKPKTRVSPQFRTLDIHFLPAVWVHFRGISSAPTPKERRCEDVRGEDVIPTFFCKNPSLRHPNRTKKQKKNNLIGCTMSVEDQVPNQLTGSGWLHASYHQQLHQPSQKVRPQHVQGIKTFH